jgi:hypothetical protein
LGGLYAPANNLHCGCPYYQWAPMIAAGNRVSRRFDLENRRVFPDAAI